MLQRCSSTTELELDLNFIQAIVEIETTLQTQQIMMMLARRPLAIAAMTRSTHLSARLSTNTVAQQKNDSVQTPLQSQNKDSIAPGAARPEGDASLIDTPLQKQRREALAPQVSPAQRKRSRAASGLLAGMIGIPPVVYYYYQYRREHMDNKRASLLEQQRQKYANGG